MSVKLRKNKLYRESRYELLGFDQYNHTSKELSLQMLNALESIRRERLITFVTVHRLMVERKLQPNYKDTYYNIVKGLRYSCQISYINLICEVLKISHIELITRVYEREVLGKK